jgi:hypothetical protein
MKLHLIRFQKRALAILPAMALAVSLHAAAEETTKPAVQEGNKLEEALKKLKLPGVTINLKERCVDVASTVCLGEGALELVACTKDTKEHESVIMIEAVPKHVHTALLLIGAKPGNPAMRKPLDKEGTRWMDVPPAGGAVDVSVVYPDKDGKMVERPINDFIIANDEGPDGPANESSEAKPERFPTSTFVFAGSILHKPEDGPPQYIADGTGSVISITTFGDELLCLPDFHGRENGSLMWQIDSTHLPPVGTKVTLRLRPKLQEKPSPEGEKTPAKVKE